MAEKQQIQVKTSKKHRPIWVKPLESSMDDPTADENATKIVKGHTFGPTDVRVYEFFIQGVPNPKDLEGVEEDQLLIYNEPSKKSYKKEMKKEKEILQRE